MFRTFDIRTRFVILAFTYFVFQTADNYALYSMLARTLSDVYDWGLKYR
jgi:hypothetical protein